MDIDLSSHEPLVITPTTESDRYEPHEKIPSSSSTIIPINSPSRRSLLKDDRDRLHRQNRNKAKQNDELVEVSRRLTKRKQLQKAWLVIHCYS
jgi:hypothetical protein